MAGMKKGVDTYESTILKNRIGNVKRKMFHVIKRFASGCVIQTVNRVPMNAYERARMAIGNREIVGFGFNGQLNYVDRSDFPCPAVRFKEPTAELTALREKEKGPWCDLTVAEKKLLYRASFCQTFAEMHAPTGSWKSTIGVALMLMSVGVWILMGVEMYVIPEDQLPETFSEERKKAQLKRILDLRMNPIDGISSKWDFDKNRWK